VQVKLNAAVKMHNGVTQLVPNHPTTLLGIPYDRPIIGYGGTTINSLRLWEASSPEFFDFGEFSHGDFFGAVHSKVMAENLTRVLYPDDSTPAGKRLRFGQEYFLGQHLEREAVPCAVAKSRDKEGSRTEYSISNARTSRLGATLGHAVRRARLSVDKLQSRGVRTQAKAEAFKEGDPPAKNIHPKRVV
jgi:hypothetical protein